jgi:hypothetical protein
VRDLAKLDLDPNTVYNVSLSVAQGAKKFDNLRFFQTKTPKLFNIVPGQYSTFSRLTTALEPVVPKIGGGTYKPADLVTVQVNTVSWDTRWKYDTSEGESSYNLDGSTVTFRVTLASAPPTFVFKMDGFNSKLACLNNRSDWKKINGTTYEVTTSVREFDPGVSANPTYREKDSGTGVSKYAVAKGQSLIYLKNKPNGVAPGLSSARASIRSGRTNKQVFAPNTRVTFVQKQNVPYYVIVNPETVIAFGKDVSITFGMYVWDKGLKWSGGRSEEGREGSAATLQYYSSPSYSPITTTYSFTGNSSISSEVLNANVLDSLIWEENIRDFIYFFISDTTSAANPTWYYFNNASNNGGITAANLAGLKISGTVLSASSGTGEERVLSAPPPAPGFVTNTSTYPSYPAIALKAKARFYQISKTNTVNDATVPSLSYPISIRFGIVRYTKGASGAWSGSWLGTDNRIKNVLSLEEAIS